MLHVIDNLVREKQQSWPHVVLLYDIITCRNNFFVALYELREFLLKKDFVIYACHPLIGV